MRSTMQLILESITSRACKRSRTLRLSARSIEGRLRILLTMAAMALLFGSVGSAQIITTFAGGGDSNITGDGGPAAQASLAEPTSVAFDSLGNLYIADYQNHRIRKVDTNGIISTVAGNGTLGSTGDGG